MTDRLTVMISSTALDLPTHRKQVMDACMRQDMFPIMMEHLPASDGDAITESLRMVDDSQIYLGIFAWRYGYVPAGHDISITEMEYNRAVEREIPRLLFLAHDDHPLKAADVETGPGAAKLIAFKKRICDQRVVAFFRSPEDLRAMVIDSLANFRQQRPSELHYVSEIPKAPEEYIAHPYVLLQTGRLIGRHEELDFLNRWVSKPSSEIYSARILNIVAIGGMGKSALTWHWYREHAPKQMQPLAGRIWWSFYESDARYENFVTRALAYTNRRSVDEVSQLPISEQEKVLLRTLDREPFLIVLDGLERILKAYARPDAARLADGDLDEQTQNVVSARGLPVSAAESFVGKHPLRHATDLRAGVFLRRLASIRAGRILVSTRLYPAALQTAVGEAVPGSFPYFLRALSDDDAVALWQSFGVNGSREALLSLFSTFENHPLLVLALASLIANYRPAPKDFDRWRSDHPDFNPFSLSVANERKSHVLQYALRGLDETAFRILYTVAAFRMPVTYDTLTGLFVGDDQLLKDEPSLDLMLTDLEDRGLLGWDKRSNRYDIHPIVRGVVWSTLTQDTRQNVYLRLEEHFESLPSHEFEGVSNLEDLTTPIELCHTLISLGKVAEAYTLFRDRLHEPLLHLVGDSRQSIELLEPLTSSESLIRLQDVPGAQSAVLNILALAYELAGQPSRAIPLYEQSNQLDRQAGDTVNLIVGTCNLAGARLLSGEIYDAEFSARQALSLTRTTGNQYWEATSLQLLGLVLGARGLASEAVTAIARALKIDRDLNVYEGTDLDEACMAEAMLWLNDPRAMSHADAASDNAIELGNQRLSTRISRLKGMAMLTESGGSSNLEVVEEQLRNALIQARSIGLTEEELPALIGLAELRRRQGRLEEARDQLDQVWELIDRGHYRLLHADASNTLAQIERDSERNQEALRAANDAYWSAWCDGPPFSYHRGLQIANEHLEALGAKPTTDLSPFYSEQFEPFADEEINKDDMYWVE